MYILLILYKYRNKHLNPEMSVGTLLVFSLPQFIQFMYEPDDSSSMSLLGLCPILYSNLEFFVQSKSEYRVSLL